MTIFTDDQKAALNAALTILAGLPSPAKIHLFAELDDETDQQPGSGAQEYLFSITIAPPQSPPPGPKDNPPVSLKAVTSLKTRLAPSTGALLGAHGIAVNQIVTVSAKATDIVTTGAITWRKLVAPGDPVDGYWVAQSEGTVTYLVNP